ncbi:response regulator [Sphingomonas oryzagri]|uniref:Response regulator transcription factor n=1 Tax=Sphingomonas oryzagri TaxID=3042314 RepID=A0ABT6N252_9SPHN|nr:response regulator transcription factor [Sphingomonas oryzagri]MDH7639368.1 response regulator transcription factor [Sphingomonas oryzagri]
MDHSTRIIIVEDDREIASLVSDMLRSNGFAATAVGDGPALRATLPRECDVSLIILDLNLPGEDGLSLCRWLRSVSTVPIIMLTARGDPIDRIIGLEIGADDYLGKPFEPRELLARIRSVLRRTAAIPSAEPLEDNDHNVRFGGWRLDRRRRHIIAADGTLVPLSGSEYRLLSALIEHRGEVLPREVLQAMAGGRAETVLDRAIDLRISRLRAKLGDALDGSPIIKTVRGRGYVFSEVIEPC